MKTQKKQKQKKTPAEFGTITNISSWSNWKQSLNKNTNDKT